ncbi:MAG: 23S rRNA (adenine(2503)-C(2))-methyltransferase RlmN [Caldilineaceae bacterium]|nr:23S rRNA (adenine(2503)-C(2))-methyltransferase RlmN [Caldilineaceae bacterium]MCB9139710.1 23S rRNA (adenine(2503)-C(2))-methyltransferase RlmN [Caldilineaceae bacterium]
MTAIPLLPTPKERDAQAARRSMLDLSREELTAFMAELGQPAFRARQIWDWIYKRYAVTFEEMTNLPRELRTRLADAAVISPLTVITETLSLDRDTQKVLFQLPDGETIETVLMLYDKRRTLCISSQVGCAMGCTFCATAQGGLARNLTAGEIVAQVLYFARYLNDPDQPPHTGIQRPARVTNIVLMGMGEPMHNYNSVWTALRRLTDPDAFGLGARHITLSTVGLVPMIDRMAHEGLQIGLAVSLHAPNDELRTQLVPVNKGYGVDDVLDAVDRYTNETGRRVTFEYALMRGINDSPELARELADKLAPRLCHVNLIPLNPIPDSPFQPASDADTAAFVQILREAGVSATVRLRRGIEINAGCGQLRQAEQTKSEE